MGWIQKECHSEAVEYFSCLAFSSLDSLTEPRTWKNKGVFKACPEPCRRKARPDLP
jgi:hypothetical protein